MYNEINDYLQSLSSNNNILTLDYDQKDEYKIIVCLHKYLSNTKRFHSDLSNKINKDNISILDKIYPGIYISIPFIKDEILSSVLSGNIIMLIKYGDFIFLYNVICQNEMKRSISDSILEPNNILGSRDGFIENIETNISLIQKRLKTNSLEINSIIVGKRSQTLVNVIFIKDIANKENVEIVTKKIRNMNTDYLLSIYQIMNLFERNSIFPLTGEVGSPDYAANELCEGRIIILVDSLPVALVVPVNLVYFFSLKEGRHSKPYARFYSTFLTYSCLFISVFFLGIYAAIITFHKESLSLLVISEIKYSLRGSTLPLYLEFIFLIFLFDLLRLSSSKSPNFNIKNVIVTVGGLLIGQNAINSGFISSFNLVIIAISYIAGYAITNNQRLITAIGILRLIFITIGFIFGLLGISLASVILLSYLASKKSLTTSYLSPIVPFIKQDFFKNLISDKFKKRKKRDKNLKPLDNTRGE